MTDTSRIASNAAIDATTTCRRKTPGRFTWRSRLHEASCHASPSTDRQLCARAHLDNADRNKLDAHSRLIGRVRPNVGGQRLRVLM